MGIQPVGSSKKLCICIYGDAGIGKTTFIGTGGKGTLILRPPVDHTDAITTPGVDEWVLHDWAEMAEAGDFLREGAKGYDFVWLDSISLMQDVGLDDIWGKVVAEKPHRAKYGLDKGEYGINMERLGQWVRAAVDAPGFNFGISALVAENRDVHGDDTAFVPFVQGKGMAAKISGYMQMVGLMRMSGKSGRRVLDFNRTPDYSAKDQHNAFKDGRLWDPTIPKLLAAVESSRKKRVSATRTASKPRRRSTSARRTTKKQGA